ncbi:MAG: O-antigen ligase family protein [Lachnospiraceae bacterium]|nr:O-antigen ligase family protein [Lachnospiraceae bacterium]
MRDPADKLTIVLYRALLFVVVMLSGGFYMYSAMLAGLLSCALILVMSFRRQRMRAMFVRSVSASAPASVRAGILSRLNLCTALPVAIILISPVISVWAVDAPLHMEGVLRLAALIAWLGACNQLDEDEKTDVLSFVPVIGLVVTGTGIAARFFPAFTDRLWQADRLGGPFQYSNTCALFLALGLVISIKQEKRKIISAALMAGILLTGSRSVLVLLFLWGVVICIFDRKRIRGFLISTALVAFSALSFFALTGNLQNIARILTLGSYKSTAFGRLLYYRDAFRMLGKFPFGLGFSGYFYIQPAYQNGVYTTRFVHNDYLQTALDLGILPAVVLMGWLLWQVFRGKQSVLLKELLIFMLAAAVTDFHFQYFSVMMLAVLCLDHGDDKAHGETGNADSDGLKKRRDLPAWNTAGTARSRLIENRILMIPVMIGFAYFLTAFTFLRMHDYDKTLDFYPHETEAELALMKQIGFAADKISKQGGDAASVGTAVTQVANMHALEYLATEKAEALATDVLSHNAYAAQAVKYIGYAAYLRGDFGEAMHMMDRMISVMRYHVEEYEAYDIMLQGIAETSAASGDRDTCGDALERRDMLRQKLQALRETTDPLAYRLRDKPVFEW